MKIIFSLPRSGTHYFQSLIYLNYRKSHNRFITKDEYCLGEYFHPIGENVQIKLNRLKTCKQKVMIVHDIQIRNADEGYLIREYMQTQQVFILRRRSLYNRLRSWMFSMKHGYDHVNNAPNITISNDDIRDFIYATKKFEIEQQHYNGMNVFYEDLVGKSFTQKTLPFKVLNEDEVKNNLKSYVDLDILKEYTL